MRILRVEFIYLFLSKCQRVSKFSIRVLRLLIVLRSKIIYPLHICCFSLQPIRSRYIIGSNEVDDLGLRLDKPSPNSRLTGKPSKYQGVAQLAENHAS